MKKPSHNTNMPVQTSQHDQGILISLFSACTNVLPDPHTGNIQRLSTEHIIAENKIHKQIKLQYLVF